jgi:hypothetical protein
LPLFPQTAPLALKASNRFTFFQMTTATDCTRFHELYQRIQVNETLTTTNCCTWDTFKVQCINDQIVTLNLQEIKTGGKLIPDLFQGFQALRGLNLSSSEFIGPIPTSITVRPYYFLNLSNNRLNGTIPNLEIEQGHNSTFLDLRGNLLTGDIPVGLKRRSQAPRPRNNSFCPFDEWLCSSERLAFCDFQFTCTGLPNSSVTTGVVDDVSARFTERESTSSGFNFVPTLVVVGVSVVILSVLGAILYSKRKRSFRS